MLGSVPEAWNTKVIETETVSLKSSQSRRKQQQQNTQEQCNVTVITRGLRGNSVFPEVDSANVCLRTLRTFHCERGSGRESHWGPSREGHFTELE